MANNRKLQGEIDRLMKKVQEGIEEFDGILSKVYAATSANQKEKYEQDLKREIKKLQRSRDQIKAWIASSEVKQKNPLVEARKLIETKMEQFKTCEKDSKTKAFSKEGLSMAQSDKDEKHDTRKWIKKILKELQTQIDTFEGELDQIPPKKRSGNSRVQELTDLIIITSSTSTKWKKCSVIWRTITLLLIRWKISRTHLITIWKATKIQSLCSMIQSMII